METRPVDLSRIAVDGVVPPGTTFVVGEDLVARSVPEHRPSYRGITLAEGVRIENPHPGQFVFVTEATGSRVLVDAEDNEVVEGLMWAQDHPSDTESGV